MIKHKEIEIRLMKNKFEGLQNHSADLIELKSEN